MIDRIIAGNPGVFDVTVIGKEESIKFVEKSTGVKII